jgi:hypothetical protein
VRNDIFGNNRHQLCLILGFNHLIIPYRIHGIIEINNSIVRGTLQRAPTFDDGDLFAEKHIGKILPFDYCAPINPLYMVTSRMALFLRASSLSLRPLFQYAKPRLL